MPQQLAGPGNLSQSSVSQARLCFACFSIDFCKEGLRAHAALREAKPAASCACFGKFCLCRVSAFAYWRRLHLQAFEANAAEHSPIEHSTWHLVLTANTTAVEHVHTSKSMTCNGHFLLDHPSYLGTRYHQILVCLRVWTTQLWQQSSARRR